MATTATDILDKEHPDITYLKQDEIGLTLSKALSETYKQKPNNPVEFFAKWLLNHTKVSKKVQDVKDYGKMAKELQEKHKYQIKSRRAEQEEKLNEEKVKEAQMQKFYEVLSKSDDLTDNLEELANYLKEFTGATGVYIGKLVQPLKEINEDDDDKAHIDEENPKVISFVQASDCHSFMKGKLLLSEQGISHDVFKDQGSGEEEADADVAEGEDEKPKVDQEDILQTFKHSYVKEVVREPRMHFYKVPRLGSFMAVPLVYNSCLFEDALDHAVNDYQEVQKRKEEQKQAQQEWEDEKQKEREEKERTGEAYEPEEKEWEVIEEQPFDTYEEKYVVCIDTLGQDRELSDQQKRFALQTIQSYREKWEKTESSLLLSDRNKKLEDIEQDKEFLDNEAAKVQEEEDKQVEEAVIAREDLDSEELKELFAKDARIRYIGRLFQTQDEWKNSLFRFKEFKVLKFCRVLQSIFYFLKFDKDQTCEPKTNRLFWKKAKHQLNDQFLDRLANYRVLGPKDEQFLPYQTLNFIQSNVESISPEDVDYYNLTLGRIFKWLLLAIKTRKEDITRRKVLKKKAAEDRETQIAAAEQREQKRQTEVAEAEEKFNEEHKEEIEAAQKAEEEEANQQVDEYGEEEEDEDQEKKPKEKPVMPIFNQEEFLTKWDEENPEVIIPEEVVEDIDNDWVLSEEDEEQLIQQYLQSKEAN